MKSNKSSSNPILGTLNFFIGFLLNFLEVVGVLSIEDIIENKSTSKVDNDLISKNLKQKSKRLKNSTRGKSKIDKSSSTERHLSTGLPGGLPEGISERLLRKLLKDKKSKTTTKKKKSKVSISRVPISLGSLKSGRLYLVQYPYGEFSRTKYGGFRICLFLSNGQKGIKTFITSRSNLVCCLFQMPIDPVVTSMVLRKLYKTDKPIDSKVISSLKLLLSEYKTFIFSSDKITMIYEIELDREDIT